ncbi:hypothetical protein OLX02_06715 [Novosphingobium sp. KCTC 2891]|uniref:hypothetical protein n=1 Tax=Novosphingobium sp. KCTC 2891 TaxID=2989730 RepID=UPI0022212CB0|nr:hypothetical protein [Novosphingobium sp. KCTC 2891]MCW1382510.1 hypothetical protein [Novosphingobium sp. KCTC 2891]
MARDTGAPRPHTRFFTRSAMVMLVCVVLSFPLTYYAPLVSGSRRFSPFHHIHGLPFFAWIGLYAWQTQLVAQGRTARHRELGLAGVALSAMMLPLGAIMAIVAIRRRIAAGDSHPFDVTFYNVVDIALFSAMMTAAFAGVTRHPDWHRRFTFAAALCLVGPAVSRWVLLLPAAFPLSDMAPNLLADLFLIALAVHDRRERGRVRPATLWAAAALVPIHIASPWIASSDWWRALAPGLLHLTG